MDRRRVMQRPSLATRMRDHQHNVDPNVTNDDDNVANAADQNHNHPVSYGEDFRNSMRSLGESVGTPTPGGGRGGTGELGDSISRSNHSLHSLGTRSTARDNDPSRLCAICEEAISIFVRDDHDDTEPTHKELARRRDALDKAWKSMREWFSTHPSKHERFLAATYLGQLSSTPLHGACKLPDPPADIIQKLIDCAPETVSWADNNGWLPLHIACATGASGDILSRLVEAYPEGKVAQDRRMRTPLHFAFNPRFGAHSTSSEEAETKEEAGGAAEGENQANANGETDGKIGNSLPAIVRLLSNSGAAGIPEQNGMLPLHYACAYGTGTAVLEVLFEAFPNSIIAKENSGRTPLHLAMVNAHRPASPSVLRFLLSIKNIDVVNARDREGHLPLHPLANIAARLGPEKQSKRQNVKQCLKMYLKAEPNATADFLTDIQSLPSWLRDEAVVTPHVQGVLNNKIVQRFPTSVLILDGYFLLIIIICFEITSIEHINYRFAGDDPTKDLALVFLFAGGVYFLFREVVQVLSLISLGFFHSWVTDWTNYLDMLVIVLVFYTGAAMVDDGLGSNDDFRTLCAFTKLVLWAAMIIFFKSIQVDFAVFVDGVFYVVQRLFAFLIAMAVILVMFALMFLVVYSETHTCISKLPEDKDFPHCTFEDSLLKVYTMMMGEIGDAYYDERGSNIAIFLFVGYSFLVVILLSNVVIAIVTDSYKVIKNERAAMVFWSNRLDFVAEMDAIASVKQKIQNPASLLPFSEGGGGGTGSVDSPNGARNSGGSGSYYSDQGAQKREPFKEVWSQLTSLFDPNLYDDIDIDTKTYEFWCYVFFKFLAMFVIIPLWLLAGAGTAGWLWPPQVRKFLFVQKRNTTMNEDLNEEVEKKTNQLQEQIRFLRKKLMGEMVVGRRELTQVRLNLDGITNDFMADLVQVKEIMTSLLELSRGLQPVRDDVNPVNVVSMEEEERLSLEAIRKMQAEEQQQFRMEE